MYFISKLLKLLEIGENNQPNVLARSLLKFPSTLNLLKSISKMFWQDPYWDSPPPSTCWNQSAKCFGKIFTEIPLYPQLAEINQPNVLARSLLRFPSTLDLLKSISQMFLQHPYLFILPFLWLIIQAVMPLKWFLKMAFPNNQVTNSPLKPLVFTYKY